MLANAETPEPEACQFHTDKAQFKFAVVISFSKIWASTTRRVEGCSERYGNLVVKGRWLVTTENGVFVTCQGICDRGKLTEVLLAGQDT